MFAAPSTEVGSIPSLIMTRRKGLPAMIDWPTMTWRQPVSSPFVVQARFELVKVHRPVEAAMDVVLARPLQFDRRAVGAAGLGDRHRFDDVVGPEVGAPAEAAAGIKRMDAHLLRIQALRSSRR